MTDSGRPSDALRERIEAAARAICVQHFKGGARAACKNCLYLAGRALDAADAASEPTPRPDASAALSDCIETLTKLEQWDMLSLTPKGRGVATADAPWARDNIRRSLDAALAALAEYDAAAPLTPPRDGLGMSAALRTSIYRARWEHARARSAALEGALRALVAGWDYLDGDKDGYDTPLSIAVADARALLAESTPPAPKAERADHPRCEVALAYDDSIGGEGLIRCNWSLDENGRCTNPDQTAHRPAAESTPKEPR